MRYWTIDMLIVTSVLRKRILFFKLRVMLLFCNYLSIQ